jgi:hypothetical protein
MIWFILVFMVACATVLAVFAFRSKYADIQVEIRIKKAIGTKVKEMCTENPHLYRSQAAGVNCVIGYDNAKLDPDIDAWHMLWEHLWESIGNMPLIHYVVHGVCEKNSPNSICRWMVERSIENLAGWTGVVVVLGLAAIIVWIIWVYGPAKEATRLRQVARISQDMMEWQRANSPQTDPKWKEIVSGWATKTTKEHAL